MTDMRWISSAGPRQYGTSKTRTSPPTRSASWRDPVVVGPQRPPDAEQVRPQPERVAALDRARRLDPPERRDAGRGRPRLDGGRLRGPVRLAGPERDRAAVGHQQRVEGVDEVRRRRARSSSTWTRGPSEARVSTKASCWRRARSRSTGWRNPCAGSSKAAPNAGPGSLDQDVAQRRGHALGAEPPLGGHHRGKDSGAPGPTVRLPDAPDMKKRPDRSGRFGAWGDAVR